MAREETLFFDSPSELDIFVDNAGDSHSDQGVIPTAHKHDGQATRGAEKGKRPGKRFGINYHSKLDGFTKHMVQVWKIMQIHQAFVPGIIKSQIIYESDLGKMSALFFFFFPFFLSFLLSRFLR